MCDYNLKTLVLTLLLSGNRSVSGLFLRGMVIDLGGSCLPLLVAVVVNRGLRRGGVGAHLLATYGHLLPGRQPGEWADAPARFPGHACQCVHVAIVWASRSGV